MADTEQLVASLEAAFGEGPPPQAPKATAPAAQPVPAEVAVSDPVADANAILEPPPETAEPLPTDEPEPEDAKPDAAPADDLAFEIEVDGKRETIRGADQVKEYLQKGVDYSRKSEEVARAREAIFTQAKMIAEAHQFQTEIIQDLAKLTAYDQQLEQWRGVDWNAAFDQDFTQAMKWREQRDRLREQRNEIAQQIERKGGDFKQRQAQAAQMKLASEEQALLAKLPEWRNSDLGQKEVMAIKRHLMDRGFTAAEVQTIPDYRYMLLARDAYLYRQLQAGKDAKLQQVRNAPPVVKPGTQPKQSGKQDFSKFQKSFKRAGREGNHRAQERALEGLLSRTFK